MGGIRDQARRTDVTGPSLPVQGERATARNGFANGRDYLNFVFYSVLLVSCVIPSIQRQAYTRPKIAHLQPSIQTCVFEPNKAPMRSKPPPTTAPTTAPTASTAITPA